MIELRGYCFTGYVMGRKHIRCLLQSLQRPHDPGAQNLNQMHLCMHQFWFWFLYFRFSSLSKPAVARREKLQDSVVLHRFLANVAEELAWIRDKEPLVKSDDLGRNLIGTSVKKDGLNLKVVFSLKWYKGVLRKRNLRLRSTINLSSCFFCFYSLFWFCCEQSIWITEHKMAVRLARRKVRV